MQASLQVTFDDEQSQTEREKKRFDCESEALSSPRLHHAGVGIVCILYFACV